MKSRDSKHFSSIARVSGAGNSTQPEKYNFEDYNFIDGTNYYYLKQVDNNGKTTLSNTISIHTSNSENFITLFPNPTNDKIQFQFLEEGETYELELFDVNGKQIYIPSEIKLIKKTTVINISFLNSGIYFLKILNAANKKPLYGRFVKS